MIKKFTPGTEYFEQITGIASKHLEALLKGKNLIPKDAQVSIKYIEQGNYKNAYKLDLLDKDGGQLIHSKVILSFKDAQIVDTQVKKLFELIKTYYKTINRKDYINNVNNIIDHASKKVIPPEQKELYKKELLDLYSKMTIKNEEEKFIGIMDKALQKKINYNGIGPESNITLFIKHSAGHPLKSSNFSEMHYFNWIHNLGMSEYSDDILPKVTKNIDLAKYGLLHNDLINNKNNLVNGRIVDYGGIEKVANQEILTDDSIVRRYNHKISQIKYKDEAKTQKMRIAYWNDLYDKTAANKVPNQKQMFKALEKSKEYISPENYSKLHDAIKPVKDRLSYSTSKASA